MRDWDQVKELAGAALEKPAAAREAYLRAACRGDPALQNEVQSILDAADAAPAFLEGAAARLENTGYQVWLTPFGWVCEWGIEVYGESLAKVFKAL